MAIDLGLSVPDGRGRDDKTFGPGRVPTEMQPGDVLGDRCWNCGTKGHPFRQRTWYCISCGTGWCSNPDETYAAARQLRYLDGDAFSNVMAKAGWRPDHFAVKDTHYAERAKVALAGIWD